MTGRLGLISLVTTLYISVTTNIHVSLGGETELSIQTVNRYSKYSVGVVLTENYYQCIHNGTDPSQLVSEGRHHKALLRLMNECLEARTAEQTYCQINEALFNTRHSSISRAVKTLSFLGEENMYFAIYKLIFP